MKNIPNKILCILCIGIGFFANAQEKIESIEMEIAGGRCLHSYFYKLDKDSIKYQHSPCAYPTQKKKINERKPNSLKNWNNTIEKINLDAFKKLADGPSQLVFDGMDTKISIKTDKNTYTKTNSSDPLWEKIIQIIRGGSVNKSKNNKCSK